MVITKYFCILFSEQILCPFDYCLVLDRMEDGTFYEKHTKIDRSNIKKEEAYLNVKLITSKVGFILNIIQ